METYIPDSQSRLVIESVRENGSKFRPSDWAERLSATTAQFGPDKKLRYASGVYPGVLNNCKCLIVVTTFIVQHPASFKHIIEFARTNNLRMYTI
jgi:hypothetical protein